MKIIFFALLVSCSSIYAQTDTIPNIVLTEEVVAAARKKINSEASFPGGDAAWIKFLTDKIQADIPVHTKAKAGTYQVVIRFIIDTSGNVTSVLPETKFGFGMEKEAIRVIRMSPKWKPAIIEGIPVPAYRRQPVTFAVQEERRRRFF